MGSVGEINQALTRLECSDAVSDSVSKDLLSPFHGFLNPHNLETTKIISDVSLPGPLKVLFNGAKTAPQVKRSRKKHRIDLLGQFFSDKDWVF
jgi:hypothetical protein